MKNDAVLKASSLLAAAALMMAGCAAPAAPQARPTPAPPVATPTPAQSPTSEAPAATPTPGDIAAAPKLKVLATFSIIADLVQNVAGDKVELFTLVGPGTDSHDYEPTPSDVAKVADVQLIFENGLGFESWLDRLYEAAGSRARRVVLSEGIDPRVFAEAHGEAEHGHTHDADGKEGRKEEGHSHDEEKAGDHAHAHGEFDPHVWQDVRNAIQMVRNIVQALSEVDPANADFYDANAEAYIAQLEALDEEIVGLIEQIPEARRKLVTSHEALGYFADRYGFEMIGAVLGTMSAMASEPSAQDFANLAEAVKAEGVDVIFLENVTNPQAVERLAREAGIRVGPSLFTDALSAPGEPGATYIDMMRYNARALRDALTQ
ncbi:MAG: metal ABC transporter substrate-binding protein [Chloroflexi bacterium]|jgi:ABC-type Zn uptake system ZnuABC Zn-binding protein ZnuA|uniref:Metal ABC transporter substrate-binding protein n=1 Tax=Candidatus Thermofonsia Clade 3 bacterium TaxID=2364212 RepID=A0A2M8QE34_9CHLR|nr:zinc ABC transporter substrate-binding protein [Candidatus Roseilinea sp. NK_OTU-006]PJF48060.1 MAG: metal ABC transporter substrate-binding protein [Candidatus Thermofonsia Clade 3 bacterium]RMG63700.1 MAG: metal ABC transporter substrate-binding protein [Chloroflexota bacterium]